MKIESAQQWAARMLMPGAACILDTETTGFDGAVIEICVMDAVTGDILVDSLVDPCGVPVDESAYAVHGIAAVDLRGAPMWPTVFAELIEATAGRTVLAYNAEFDQSRIAFECLRHELAPGQLGDPMNWECVMLHRSQALGIEQRLALGGNHRARGDVAATRELLWDIASGSVSPAHQMDRFGAHPPKTGTVTVTK